MPPPACEHPVQIDREITVLIALRNSLAFIHTWSTTRAPSKPVWKSRDVPLTAHCWFNRGEEEKRRKILLLLRSSVYWRLSRFTACITFVPTYQQPANQLTSPQSSPTPTPTLAYYRPSQQKYLAHSFHYWLAVSLNASVIVYHSVKHPPPSD